MCVEDDLGRIIDKTRKGDGNVMNKIKADRRVLLVAAIVVLLLLNVAMMGDSFAKYKDTVVIDQSAAVLEFDPEIGECYDYNGNIVMDESGEIPCKFVNPQEVDVKVILILETEGELPIAYTLVLEDGTEIEGDREGNEYTFTFPVPAGETPEFKVVPSWNAPNYDERFNGLGEDIHIRIICEQDVGE